MSSPEYLAWVDNEQSYNDWLAAEQAPDPIPIPSTPVEVHEVTVRYTVKISSGLSLTKERRVLRSYNPSAPHPKGTPQ